MSNNQLTRQLNAFTQWKQRQLRILNQLKPWLKAQALYSADAQRAIRHAAAMLTTDSITFAVVGEFSRGKTELINALFFNQYGQRLLPTDAGRTTMCPTEIFQDDRHPPYLRLLPVESRLEETSLAELQRAPERWRHIPLNLDDTDELKQHLSQISASQEVSVDEATKLGLYSTEEYEHASGERVTIPKWRLAQINFRHPMLAEGLRILDTPGLNAVGAEPELTYEILPKAQAKVFVLGVDTGVSRSDLEIWRQISSRPGRARNDLLVVLNKIDTLWDDLRSDDEIEQTIARQRQDVSRMLGISESQVHTISAQKALVSRVRKDVALEKRSRIMELESHLANSMIGNRQQLIIEQSSERVSDSLATIEGILISRLNRLRKQAETLEELNSQGEAAIQLKLRKMGRDRKRYQQAVEAYRSNKEQFQALGRNLTALLSPNDLKEILERARKTMTSAWSTVGLKASMKELFDEINRRMHHGTEAAEAMRRLLRMIYRRFQTDHRFECPHPELFSLTQYQVELKLLHQEAEIFRNSPRFTLSEQHFVIKRYFNTIIHRVVEVFRKAHRDAGHWLEAALDPLSLEIREYRDQINQELNNLKLASKSRETIGQRQKLLERDSRKLKVQLASLKNVRRALANSAMPNDQGRVTPTLVKKQA